MSQINWHEILTSTLSVCSNGIHYSPCILGKPVPGTEDGRWGHDNAQRYGEYIVSFLADILTLVTTQLADHLGLTVVGKTLGADTAGVVDAVRKDPWDAISLAALADMIEERRGETVEAERIRSLIVGNRSILVLEYPPTTTQQNVEANRISLKKLADRLGCECLVIPRIWRLSVVNPKE